MKTKIKTRIQSQSIQMGSFIILFLSINLYYNSLFASGHSNEKIDLRLSSTAGFAADSSGSDLLSANYILNKNQQYDENGLQYESRMIQYDTYQNPGIKDIHMHSLSIEEDYSTESWMLNPDLLISNMNPDPFGDEEQTEEEIRFENWMINTSSWVEDNSCH
jgi:hypothetical protein